MWQVVNSRVLCSTGIAHSKQACCLFPKTTCASCALRSKRNPRGIRRRLPEVCQRWATFLPKRSYSYGTGQDCPWCTSPAVFVHSESHRMGIEPALVGRIPCCMTGTGTRCDASANRA